MSIQFKSITELNELLDNKAISASELNQESIQLAKKYSELNCFVTLNEENAKKNQPLSTEIKKSPHCFQEFHWHKKTYFAQKV